MDLSKIRVIAKRYGDLLLVEGETPISKLSLDDPGIIVLKDGTVSPKLPIGSLTNGGYWDVFSESRPPTKEEMELIKAVI